MANTPCKPQADNPIDVSQWAQHEDFPVFPIGSKPKRMLVSPEVTQEPFLIPNHAYLFKTAVGWQAQQVWSEVVSYRIGKVLGLDVPPAFIAIDSSTGETGVLVEFFYGYPGEQSPARLVHAADLMTRVLADKKRGRPHAVRLNMHLCKLIVGEAVGVAWWSTALAFDALIGNTDRHPENWGFLVRRQHAKNNFAMAPIFDNGTSLGYEMPEAKLAQIIEPARLSHYLNKGTHHCCWDVSNDCPTPHFDLLQKVVGTYEGSGAFVENVIRFKIGQIEEIVAECTRFDVATPFTNQRADFVTALIEARRSRLEALLDG
ncbi:HipA domain-containing protein (plasmid) [Aminobacter sp. BA135]|uniref:HipA domain-containing protein n=1 Tax=Aminobacter sp. BA135 TaxID=537596 RepID=UPI003D7AB3CB